MLSQLQKDEQMPRRVKESILELKEVLGAEGEDDDIKINTCLEIAEEFNETCELNSYSRAKIWSLVSKLEEFNV